MTVYNTRTGAAQSNQDTGSVVHQWRVCPHCGRGSFLLDECPDCGHRLQRRQSVLRLALNLLAVPAGTALCVWLLLRLQRVLRQTAGWLGNLLGFLAVAAALFVLLGIALWAMQQLWRQRQLLQVCWLWQLPQNGRQNPLRLPAVQQAKAAYYADIAWLEQAVPAAEADPARRDGLFGRALWLSQLCDCPRLAMLRFRLLCAAPLQEGDATDHAAILRQIAGSGQRKIQWLLEQKNGWQTLLDCLCMDPQGPCEEWGALVCARMLVLAEQNKGALAGLTEEDRRQMVDVLVFCGAEGLLRYPHSPVQQQLRGSRYYPELERRMPALEPPELR